MNVITLTTKQLRDHLTKSQIYYSYQETSAGLLLVLSTEKGIFQATFVPQKKPLPQYQELQECTIKSVILAGTDFQVMVWKALLQIHRGQTTFYQHIAQTIGHPKSHRAVANAVGDNKIAYFVPCHRVVRKTGDICGYNWGVEKKRALLESEK